MAPTYTKKTGDVFIRNYDRGITETLGGTVRTCADGKNNSYFVDIAGVDPFAVPVIWSNPEQVFEDNILPCILINRDSVEPALRRWHSIGQDEYMAGVTGGVSGMVPGGIVEINGVTGYQYIETKPQAWPYDITYTITAFARFEHEAINMIRFIMRKYQPYSKVKVIDSINETRYYSVYVESTLNDISEIVDVADRTKGYSVTLRVEAELDLKDPVVLPTLAGIEFNLVPS